MSEPGKLVLVGTPIGNLGDLSPRAVSVLASAQLILCEDTRRTRELLSHAGLKGRRLLSVHAHNELSRASAVVERILAGDTAALVSDAGMPLVSDPGWRLVRRAIESGITVSAVPGPNAALTALVLSGLPCDRFSFEGFLPRKGSERHKRLRQLESEERTTVVYESPLRLRATIEDLCSVCGPDRAVAIARELTKIHEEVWRGTLAEAEAFLAEHQPRGEVVLVLGPAVRRAPDEGQIASMILTELADGKTPREVAQRVSSELGVGRRAVYELALTLKDREHPE